MYVSSIQSRNLRRLEVFSSTNLNESRLTLSPIISLVVSVVFRKYTDATKAPVASIQDSTLNKQDKMLQISSAILQESNHNKNGGCKIVIKFIKPGLYYKVL